MKKWLIALICLSIPITLVVLGLCLPNRILFLVGVILFMFTFIGAIFMLMVASGKNTENEQEEDKFTLKEVVSEYFNPSEDYDDYAGLDEKSIEEKQLDEINSSSGTQNTNAQIKRMLSFRRREMQLDNEWHTNYWGCVVGILFAILMVLTLFFFVLTMIFSEIKYLIVALSMMGGIAVLIITTVIILVSQQQISFRRAKKYENTNNYEYKRKFLQGEAVVVMSLISSYTTFGGSDSTSGSPVRIGKNVYRILMKCGNKRLIAYSHIFYNKDDVVSIIYKPDKISASIINEHDWLEKNCHRGDNNGDESLAFDND